MHFGIVITVLALQMMSRCDSSRCYEMTCFQKNCLRAAIGTNAVSTCQMNETFGCIYTKMVSSSVMVIAKCASGNCIPMYSAPAQETLCCTHDLCNNGTFIPDQSSTVHCHSYICTSGWDCLQKGVSAGHSRTCPSNTRYGCFVHKSQSSRFTSVRAGCSEHACKPISAEVGDAKDEYTCCSGNLCNDGNKREDDNANNRSGVCFVTPKFLTTVFSVLMTVLYVKTREI